MLTAFTLNDPHPAYIATLLPDTRRFIASPSELAMVRTADGHIVLAGPDAAKLDGHVNVDAYLPRTDAGRGEATKVIGEVTSTARAPYFARPTRWAAAAAAIAGALCAYHGLGDGLGVISLVVTGVAAAYSAVCHADDKNEARKLNDYLARKGVDLTKTNQEPPITMAEAMVLAGHP